MKRPTVYMLASRRNGVLYIGVTSDPARRMAQHKESPAPGFARRYGVRRLVWYETHETMESAIAREKAMKKWKRAWKTALIERANPSWRDLSADLR